MTILIVDNYDSFTYNLYQAVQALSIEEVHVQRNDCLDFAGVRSLAPSRVILSPGPGHPGNEKDFGVCRDIVVRQDEIGCPVLGVCLGHQGIVHHLGGRVIGASSIVHGKASEIRLTAPSPLFEGLPEIFEAMRYHSLVADEKAFPDDLMVTGRDDKEGLIMALQHRRRPLYGVQFHPESIGTPMGERILRNFIERC